MTKYFNGSSIILGVLLLFLLCWLGLISYFGMPDNAGTFGDQFGAVNALFSALALAGVIYTLIQQQQEMKAQRREFMNSRAYTLAYKQVELIKDEFKIAENTIYFPNPNFLQEHQYTFSQACILLYEDLGNSHKSEFERLTRVGCKHFSCIRILANSCDLIVRLYKDGMNDEDGTILFNAVRYNIDKSVWTFCKVLNEASERHEVRYNIIKEYCHESLERINRFNEIYYQIKKDTDDIDGK